MNGLPLTNVPLVDTLLEASAWDGIGSSIVGGLISGAVVLIGLAITFRHEKRNRGIDDDRRLAYERREAANRLIVAVHNARDAAVRSKGADAGDFPLWPLRECLLLTQSVLGAFPSYRAAEDFYGHLEDYRDWARASPPPRREEQCKRAENERRLLDSDGHRVMWLLQHKPDDSIANTDDVPNARTVDPQLP